jgi:hypothetical protein
LMLQEVALSEAEAKAMTNTAKRGGYICCHTEGYEASNRCSGVQRKRGTMMLVKATLRQREGLQINIEKASVTIVEVEGVLMMTAYAPPDAPEKLAEAVQQAMVANRKKKAKSG